MPQPAPPAAAVGDRGGRAGIWNVCLTHDPALGGLYRATNDFARALDAPILSFDDGRRPRADLAALDHALRIPCGTGPLARDCHVMARAAAEAADAALQDARLLVVHSLFRAHAPWAAGWARAHRRRYWAVPHGCLDPWGLAQRGLAKRAWLTVHGRRFLADADRVVFSTGRALEKARPWVRGDRTVVVHWPVETPAHDHRTDARSRFHAAHGIPADVPLLLFVGRLHAVKRPLETIDRFCRAATGGAHLVMVCGAGPIPRERLVAAIPASHAGRIHVVGPFTEGELADAYLASDGFVSLSFQENFGYAAAEAVAYGLPLVLSPGHDLAHDMPRTASGQLACGWLLPDDSAPAAVEALSAWAGLAAGTGSDRTRLESLGAIGRGWASETLGIARFRDTLQRLAGIDVGLSPPTGGLKS